ncbi:unnamed protein product [Polarella glacialis]|uniref:Uncharacterized protein n=1 Tax=Polarella glacialis TaxID=89957 RepID=A0A813H7G4_POLGL|nr:unnamed protein product [Polarella glacialis]
MTAIPALPCQSPSSSRASAPILLVSCGPGGSSPSGNLKYQSSPPSPRASHEMPLPPPLPVFQQLQASEEAAGCLAGAAAQQRPDRMPGNTVLQIRDISNHEYDKDKCNSTSLVNNANSNNSSSCRQRPAAGQPPSAPSSLDCSAAPVTPGLFSPSSSRFHPAARQLPATPLPPRRRLLQPTCSPEALGLVRRSSPGHQRLRTDTVTASAELVRVSRSSLRPAPGMAPTPPQRQRPASGSGAVNQDVRARGQLLDSPFAAASAALSPTPPPRRRNRLRWSNLQQPDPQEESEDLARPRQKCCRSLAKLLDSPPGLAEKAEVGPQHEQHEQRKQEQIQQQHEQHEQHEQRKQQQHEQRKQQQQQRAQLQGGQALLSQSQSPSAREQRLQQLEQMFLQGGLSPLPPWCAVRHTFIDVSQALSETPRVLRAQSWPHLGERTFLA